MSILQFVFMLAVFTPGGTAEELRVACWNVQNLFDSRRDTDESGELVLSADELHKVMAKKAKVIRDLGADIVGLVEVENRRVLRLLCERHLKRDGFKYYQLIEETDPRGIDVAMISKRPFTSQSFATPGHTRGILACRFTIQGDPFYVLINHWKSRRDGGEEIRMASARRVRDVVTNEIPQYEGRSVPVLVMGDLNDDDNDASLQSLEAAGLTNLLKSTPSKDRFTYLWWDYDKKKVVPHSFDHILVNRSFLDRKRIDIAPSSAKVFRPSYLFRPRELDGREYRWIDGSYKGHVGHSDHLPVSLTVILND